MRIIDPQDCPYYLTSRVTLLVTSEMKKGFAEAGVSSVKPAYLGVLIALWKEDGLKVVDLGRKSCLEPSTMTGMLDRMERDGLAYRAADPTDRRVQLVFLTDEGRAVQKPVLAAVDRVMNKVYKGISDDDLSQTMATLRKVIDNANKG